MMPIINGKRVEVILNPYIDAAMTLSIENHMKCWKEKSNQQLREDLNSTTMYVTLEIVMI